MQKNGSHLYWPLEIVAPRFLDFKMSQRNPLISSTNSLLVEFSLNFDLKWSDRWNLSLTGLTGMKSISDVQLLPADSGKGGLNFCLNGFAGKGSWNNSSNTLTLSLCNNVSILENVVVGFSFNLTNQGVIQLSPPIGIMAVGPVAIPSTAFSYTPVPSAFVTNDTRPLYLLAIFSMNTLSTTWSYACGGQVLVSGHGLTMQYKNISGIVKRPTFFCQFDPLGVNLRSEGSVLNSTLLSCIIPPFPSVARSVPFEVTIHLDPITSPLSTETSLLFNGSYAVLGSGALTRLDPGPASSGVSFQFLECWNGIVNGSISRGRAYGGTPLAISGCGFDFDTTYVCTFWRGSGESISVAAIFVAGDELICLSPIWGVTYTAGSVVVNLTTVAPDSATLSGGAPVGMCPGDRGAPATIQFLFYAEWTLNGVEDFQFPLSLRLYNISAAGGDNVTLRGVGFESRASYLCQFSYGSMYSVNSSTALVLSPTLLQCTFPPWLFRKINYPTVRLFVLEGGEVPLASSQEASSAEIQLFLSERYTSVFPAAVSAKGGAQITVFGFGFDPAVIYAATFLSATMKKPYLEVVKVLTSQTILLTTPSWDCIETVYISLYALTSTWPSVYREIEMVPGYAAIAIEVYPEAVAVSPSFANRIGGTALTIAGFGFSPQGVKYFGTFRSSSAENKTRSTAQVIATSCNEIVLISPTWDNATNWTAYRDSTLPLVLFAQNHSQLWSVAPSGGLPVALVQVNAQPSFDGPTQLWVDVANGVHAKLEYAQNLSTGSPLEIGQKLSFRVESALPAVLFAQAPTVQLNGSQGILDFTTASYGGKATVRIYLVDDGGTDYGGLDTSILHIVTVNVVPASILVNNTVRSLENEGEYIFMNFVPQLTTGLEVNTLELFAVQNLSTVAATYFQVQPYITQNGDLRFQSASNVFGRVLITVSITRIGVPPFITQSTPRNVTIVIEQVNQPPSFTMVQSAIVLNESASPALFVSAVALNILKGPNTTKTGPAGEDWSESTQRISFVIVLQSGNISFSTAPTLNSSGYLSFVLSPRANGVSTFEIFLVDNGGTMNGGNNVSEPAKLTVTVNPVNEPPGFAVNCTSSPFLYSCLQCKNGGNVSGCKLGFRVDENCGHCPNATVAGCSRALVVPHFATNITPSIYNSMDEIRSQKVSFVILSVSDSSKIFNSSDAVQPTIDTTTGTLTFCVGKDRSGNVTFAIRLVDNGGTDRGGINSSDAALLSIEVTFVNQAPEFDLCQSCGNLNVWKNDGPHVYVNFALPSSIRKGSPASSDLEQWQSLTFQILPTNGSLAFTTFPTLYVNGTLVFEGAASSVGIGYFRVVLLDNGGTLDGGQNQSESVVFSIITADSYLDLTIYSAESSFNFSDLSSQNRFEAAIYRFLNVAFGSLMRLPTSDNTSYRLLGPRIEDTVRQNEQVDLVISMLSICIPNQPTCYRKTLRRKNAGNIAAFAVQNATLIEKSTTQNFSSVSIVNVTTPHDVLLDALGHERPAFDVSITAFHTWNEEWSLVTSDGGFLDPQPIISASGSPTCTNGTLSFSVPPFRSGEGEYSIYLEGSNVSKSLKVSVLFVNQAPSFQFFQGSTLSVNEFNFPENTTRFLVDNISKGPSVFITGPYGPDWMEIQQNLSFIILGQAGNVSFDRNPAINSSGYLSFIVSPHSNGISTVSFLLADDGGTNNGGKNASEPAKFTLVVNPVNEPPGFAVNCTSSPFLYSCLQCKNGGNVSGCKLGFRVDENCGHCPNATVAGCSRALVVPHFATNITPSIYNSMDEIRSQKVSFVILSVSDSSKIFNSSDAVQPTIDTTTGTLTFCVGKDRSGNVTFAIRLVDNGGTDRGGINSSDAALLSIEVTFVNQAPEFDLCQSCGNLNVWKNDGPHVYVNFALPSSIRKGSPASSDLEQWQSLTFQILPTNGSLAFTTFPTLYVNGTLVFEGAASSVGIGYFRVVLLDNGGTFDGGRNESVALLFSIVLSDSYFLLDISLGRAAAFSSSDLGVMGTTAASSFSVQANLITFNVSLTAITCIVRGPQIENTIEDGTPASVKNFVTALISLFPYVDFESVLMTRLRKNFGNSPQFLVVNLTINETTSNTNFTWLGLPSITTKEDTPLDLLGRERPGFEIRPIRYRLWNRMDWIEDGTDGGLLATGPTALAVGDPACTNGTLSIVSRAYFNGAADFLITMEGVVSHALSIVVLPVNLPPTFQARLSANMSENSSATFPGFFYNVFAGYDQKAGVGVVYEGANQSQTVNLSIAYLGYGPYVWTQNSQMISGSASVVPSLLLVSTAAGSAATLVDLHVQVRDFVYGTFFFSAHATDSLGAVSNASNFTIRVRPVDGRPLILSNTTFKLAEDQYAVSPLVQNALANPLSLMWVEEVLNSTYTVTPLGPGVPSSSISILPNGTLLLSTLKYHNGNTTWSVKHSSTSRRLRARSSTFTTSTGSLRLCL